MTVPYWNPYREPGNALGEELRSQFKRVEYCSDRQSGGLLIAAEQFGGDSAQLQVTKRFICTETQKSGTPADSGPCGAWKRSTAMLLGMVLEALVPRSVQTRGKPVIRSRSHLACSTALSEDSAEDAWTDCARVSEPGDFSSGPQGFPSASLHFRRRDFVL